MSKKLLPLPESEGNPLYPDEWEKFGRDLVAAGFAETSPKFDGKRAWHGSLAYEWDLQGTTHKDTSEIRVELPAGFPFEKPYVYPAGKDPVSNARHQAPTDMNSWLCLWSDDNAGWQPGTTAEKLLQRIRNWLQFNRSGRWLTQDQPPDLHLYYPTKNRQLMITGDDWEFPLDQVTGRFRIWTTRPSARLLATRLDSDVKDLPALKILGPNSELSNGIWFRLKREPAPRQNLHDLLAEIDATADKDQGWALQELKGLLGQKIRDQNSECVFAMGYPRVNGETAWLFLKADMGEAKRNGNGKWARTGTMRTIQLKSYETAPADKATMTKRTEHLAEGLRGKHVVIFGIGAIGSTIALLLAKAGVGRLTLVDGEILRPGNSVRHECGLELAGASKTNAMKLQISYYAPYCRVEVAGTTWDPKKLRAIISTANIAVDATATTGFSLLLNEICLSVGIPAIYVTGHRRAAVGRIRVVRPDRSDACLVCYEGEGGLADAGGTYPIIPAGPEGEFVETGCGSTTVQASAVDIEAIANQGARTTIWILLNRLNAGNHCTVVNEVLPEAPEPLKKLGANWSSWKRLGACKTCSLHESNAKKETPPELAAS